MVLGPNLFILDLFAYHRFHPGQVRTNRIAQSYLRTIFRYNYDNFINLPGKFMGGELHSVLLYHARTGFEWVVLILSWGQPK